MKDVDPADSIALYDAIADGYDEHFSAPHRKAYDDLAWEAVVAALAELSGPDGPGGQHEPGRQESMRGTDGLRVVDAGCGAGRWASRLVALGHRVVGIDQAPAMVAAARGRGIDPDRFEVVAGDMATARAASLPPGGADLTMAMGSLQYCVDPAAGLARLAELTRPGGIVMVLVDSRLALVLELLAAGKDGEAVERARTGRGVWRLDGKEAGLHLFDAAGLLALCAGAGLVDLTVRGLLVGASAFGRDGLTARLTDDYDAALARERQLAATPGVADTGKQLLARGRKP